MQLRFRCADRDADHLRDLFVLVPFNVVQHENRAITGRQLLDGVAERDAVNDRHVVRVFRAFNYLDRSLAVVCGLLHPHAAFAEVHQDLVDRQTMQPSGKRRLTAKAADLSEELNKDFLREVFGFGSVRRHAKAQRIDAPVVTLIQLLERLHVAIGCGLRQLVVGARLCFGFSYGQRIKYFSGKENQPLQSVPET